MSLDTQTFGMSRYWLSVALAKLPSDPDLFSRRSLCTARKAFLAGKNGVAGLKSWLLAAKIIKTSSSKAELTPLGKLMAAQDPRAQQAWTWWLFHLHLSANADSFPYCTFFKEFDPEINSWSSFDEIVKKIFENQSADKKVAERSVNTYFEGIERTFRPTWPIYGLGLIERRTAIEESKKELIRRRCVKPQDLIVLYSTLLFQTNYFPNQTTVEAKELIEIGLSRALGISSSDLRNTFVRIHQDAKLGEFLKFTKTANLDSVQFVQSGEENLQKIRTHIYNEGNVQWP